MLWIIGEDEYVGVTSDHPTELGSLAESLFPLQPKANLYQRPTGLDSNHLQENSIWFPDWHDQNSALNGIQLKFVQVR